MVALLLVPTVSKRHRVAKVAAERAGKDDDAEYDADAAAPVVVSGGGQGGGMDGFFEWLSAQKPKEALGWQDRKEA